MRVPPTLAEGDNPRPRVRVPSATGPGLIIVAIGGALALVLLLSAVLRPRAASERPSADLAAFPEPPSLAIPAEAPPPALARTLPAPPPMAPAPISFPRLPPPVPTRPPAAFPTARREIVERPAPTVVAMQPLKSDAASGQPAVSLVIDNGQEEGGTAQTSGNIGSPATPGGGARGGAADDTPIRSSALRSRTNLVSAGTLIPAVLETPVDTARPGLLRAMVSRDIRGFDGTAVLIPRGTRLIGEYDSDVRSGQDRVLATWTRLIRPDGTTSRIGSPATDALGGGGIPGKVHSFFLQRFASAVLQSALAAGVNYAATAGGGSVVVAVPGTQGASTIGQTLTPSSDLKPKITVKPGVSINVFVARDLELPSFVPR